MLHLSIYGSPNWFPNWGLKCTMQDKGAEIPRQEVDHPFCDLFSIIS